MTDYYDIPALSASGINKWWSDSPYIYWKESPFNLEREKSEPTPAMLFGTLCHTFAFEPDKVGEQFVVRPECDRRTKEGKEIYASFEAEAAGRRIIGHEQYLQASRMRDHLYRHPVASKLIAGCKVEESFMWEDGLPRKAKLDAYKDGLILDYKTGANINWHDLDSYICKMGYYRQAAFYSEAFRQRHGASPDGFVFIFQDSDFPDIIACKAIEPEAIEVGLAECNEAAADIAERLKNNDWLPPDRITGVTLPAWKMNQYYNREMRV